MEWEIPVGFVDSFVHPSGSKYLLFMKNDHLELFNFETKAQRPIGLVFKAPYGRGLLLASEDGRVIIHTIHRTLQVLRADEFESEIPRYLTIEVKND